MFERFNAGAQRVVDHAREEALGLGHAHIGTEHLLLGILAGQRTSAGRLLTGAGATLDACRTKVVEAVGPPGPGKAGEPEFTDRARRALERADRLALRRRDPGVEPDHVLLSLIDVEGRAGQVLRGVGVDLPLLRAAVVSALETSPPQAAASPEEAAPEAADPAGSGADRVGPPGPHCGACGSDLGAGLSHRVLRSGDGADARDLLVAYCPSCGQVLGVSGT